eukprot:GHVP01037671.1.p1 GENE.GHVP01037671.1~~GHVP01037671.1.p1  ORF type:complete len:122 (-),score=36.37 GHVP01037671.1:171-536(-)
MEKDTSVMTWEEQNCINDSQYFQYEKAELEYRIQRIIKEEREITDLEEEMDLVLEDEFPCLQGMFYVEMSADEIREIKKKEREKLLKEKSGLETKLKEINSKLTDKVNELRNKYGILINPQ